MRNRRMPDDALRRQACYSAELCACSSVEIIQLTVRDEMARAKNSTCSERVFWERTDAYWCEPLTDKCLSGRDERLACHWIFEYYQWWLTWAISHIYRQWRIVVRRIRCFLPEYFIRKICPFIIIIGRSTIVNTSLTSRNSLRPWNVISVLSGLGYTKTTGRRVRSSHRCSRNAKIALNRRRENRKSSNSMLISLPSSFQSDVMRRIADNAECAEVLVATIRHLTRPVMAFVRLSQGQLLSKDDGDFCCRSFSPSRLHSDNMTEVPLPVKFLFLLMGPAMEEYFETGRCLSTLFSTPVVNALLSVAQIRMFFRSMD